MSKDWQADLMEAHRLLCPEQVGATPAMPAAEVQILRIRLIGEEWDELYEAVMEDDISGAADAMGDMIYVILGTAVAMGIDMGPVWDEIHRANLSKAGGERRPDGKWLKPPGFMAPDIAGVLGRQRPLGEIYPGREGSR